MSVISEALDICLETRFTVRPWVIKLKQVEHSLKRITGLLVVWAVVFTLLIWMFVHLTLALVFLGVVMITIWSLLVAASRGIRKYNRQLDDVVRFVSDYSQIELSKEDIEASLISLYLNKKAIHAISKIDE